MHTYLQEESVSWGEKRDRVGCKGDKAKKKELHELCICCLLLPPPNYQLSPLAAGHRRPCRWPF